MIEKMPLKFVEISSEKGPIPVDHALWVKLPIVQTVTVQMMKNFILSILSNRPKAL